MKKAFKSFDKHFKLFSEYIPMPHAPLQKLSIIVTRTTNLVFAENQPHAPCPMLHAFLKYQ
jgi:hypothetical protein